MAAQSYYNSFPNDGAPPPYSSLPAHPQGGGGSPQPAPYGAPANPYLSPQTKPYASPHQQPTSFPWNAPQQSSYGPPVVYQQPPPQQYNHQLQVRPHNPPRVSDSSLLAPPNAVPVGQPLGPSRSHSEPPENRRHHHHHHHSSSSRSRSRSRHSHRDRSLSRSRSRSSSRSGLRPRREKLRSSKSDTSRNTFLGAGAGGILGDAIFPGLGTLVGALAGGAGGHEYSRRRDSQSRDEHHHHHSGGSRRRLSDAADRRDGITVHSGFIRR